MQKNVVFALSLMFVPAMVLAQADFRVDTKRVVETNEVVDAEKANERNLVAPQQVYVVQNAPSAPVRASQVTVVEDTPLKESKADALRRSRMEVETETEQRIVEKLESERMRAERERAEKISKALDGQQAEAAPAPAPVAVAPVAPVVMQPIQQAPVVQVVEPAPIMESVSAKEELKEEKIEKSRVYVAGLAGVADYPSMQKIKGLYSAGASVGILFPDRLAVETSFLFSTFDFEPVPCYPSCFYPVIKEMDQTNILGAVKYQVIDGRIRPTVGVLAGYTRRVYRDRQYAYQTTPDVTSHAFDAGISGGADVILTDTFSAGFDVKYLFNMSYRIENQRQTSLVNPQNFDRDVEGLDYYMINFGAKLTF